MELEPGIIYENAAKIFVFLFFFGRRSVVHCSSMHKGSCSDYDDDVDDFDDVERAVFPLSCSTHPRLPFDSFDLISFLLENTPQILVT